MFIWLVSHVWVVYARKEKNPRLLGTLICHPSVANSKIRASARCAASALGSKSWLFAGSDRGGQRATVLYCRIFSVKMNEVDPQAWPAHLLANIAQHPARRL
jgi:hypothetical protein